MAGSGISFFQRYSQPENHVTNNTALLLRHIYQASPFKLQAILNKIVDSEAISVGPTFLQQERRINSVPDASITQRNWRVIVETKIGPHLDDEQIERHMSALREGDGDVFVIGLTTQSPSADRLASIAARAQRHHVSFAWRSFEELCDIIDQECLSHEVALREVVEDYRAFLDSLDLLDTPSDRIYVVPCGASYDDNERFRLYYHPPERKYRPFKYLGLYRQRCVSLVGEVEAIAVCNFATGTLDANVEKGPLTHEHRERIIAAIEATAYYDLREPTRFFLANALAPVDIRKVSRGGIMGPRYLSVAELTGSRLSPNLSLEGLATQLSGATFD
ncbi:MAG TPA: hypothetical protein PLK37_09925 [Terricaulis sp.]|nr:hypothetical protein [Terricaulis sp.]